MSASPALRDAARREPGATRFEFSRHRGPVTSVASLPGSDVVLTSGYDGGIGRFDFRSRRVSLIGHHAHLVNRVVVDASGRRIASCSSDHSIAIWDPRSGTRLQTLLGHADDVEDFVFIDERLGASASRDHRILVWDLGRGAVLRVLEGHEKDVLSLDHRGGVLLSSGDDRTLRRWNLATGACEQVIGPFDVETDTCAIDRVHDRVVLGCDDGVVRVFDLRDGRMTRAIEAHGSGVKRVAASPVNGDLLSAAYDQRVRIWNGADLTPRFDLEWRSSTWERSLAWSDDGNFVLGGTFGGSVRRWSAARGALSGEVAEGPEPEGNACFNDLAVSRDGQVALVGDDGWLRVVESRDGRLGWLQRIAPAHGRVLMNAVAIARGGDLVVGGAHDQRIQLWRRRCGVLEVGRSVEIGEGPVNAVQIGEPRGGPREIFVGCYSGAVVRVSDSGEIVARMRCHAGAVKAIRLHPSQSLGVSCAADGSLHAWSFDGRVVDRYRSGGAILNDLDLDGAGARVASVGRDFALQVHRLCDGRLMRSVPLGRRSLKSVAFVGTRAVAVGDYWGGVARVDLESGRVLRRRIATNGLSALRWDGTRLLACSYDGRLFHVGDRDLEPRDSLAAMVQRPPEAPSAH